METPDGCYKTLYGGAEYQTTWQLTMVDCLIEIATRTSSVPMKINSQMLQDVIEKQIASSRTRPALNIFTGLKVQRKVFTNRTFSSITWLDEKNRPLPYANFADNQTPAGIACVSLSKKKNYKWITVDCERGHDAGGVACEAEKGRIFDFESNHSGYVSEALLYVQGTFKYYFPGTII